MGGRSPVTGCRPGTCREGGSPCSNSCRTAMTMTAAHRSDTGEDAPSLTGVCWALGWDRLWARIPSGTRPGLAVREAQSRGKAAAGGPHQAGPHPAGRGHLKAGLCAPEVATQGTWPSAQTVSLPSQEECPRGHRTTQISTPRCHSTHNSFVNSKDVRCVPVARLVHWPEMGKPGQTHKQAICLQAFKRRSKSLKWTQSWGCAAPGGVRVWDEPGGQSCGLLATRHWSE